MFNVKFYKYTQNEHFVLFLLSMVNLKTKKGKKKIIKSKNPNQYRLPKTSNQGTNKSSTDTKKKKRSPKKGMFISRKKKTTKLKSTEPENGIPSQLEWIQEDPQELLLSRFIETPKGKRLGESIGIDKTRLIMKKKSKFYSIPLKAIKEKDDVLILVMKVNWKLAAKLGENWRKRTLDLFEFQKTQKSKVIKIE